MGRTLVVLFSGSRSTTVTFAIVSFPHNHAHGWKGGEGPLEGGGEGEGDRRRADEGVDILACPIRISVTMQAMLAAQPLARVAQTLPPNISEKKQLLQQFVRKA